LNRLELPTSEKQQQKLFTARSKSKAFTPAERVTFLCLCKDHYNQRLTTSPKESTPGLRNVVEMLAVLTRGGRIEAAHLSAALSRTSVPATPAPQPGQDLRGLQQQAMTAALRESGCNIAKAARMLGIARSTLYARLARCG